VIVVAFLFNRPFKLEAYFSGWKTCVLTRYGLYQLLVCKSHCHLADIMSQYWKTLFCISRPVFLFLFNVSDVCLSIDIKCIWGYCLKSFVISSVDSNKWLIELIDLIDWLNWLIELMCGLLLLRHQLLIWMVIKLCNDHSLVGYFY